MSQFNQPWLTEDEMLFDRMETFHRQRVEVIASGQSLLGKRDDALLVVHLIPRSCVLSRTRFDGANLKQHGSKLTAFGEQSAYSAARFNVDGLLNIDSVQAAGSYLQLFRDGRLEAVMSEVAYQINRQQFEPDQKSANQPRYLRTAVCERAVIKLVKDYVSFCAGIGLHAPITIYSALVGCKGVMFYSEWGHRNSLGGIDRTPAFLPEVEIASLNTDLMQLLQPWCDTLWQACGLEKSLNFDEAGKWRERREAL